MPTKIEWAEETWNPVTGCTPISAACHNCYARQFAKARLRGRFGYPKDDPFRPGVVHEDKLDLPSRWRKPRRIFVCSMGDLFHKKVDGQHINRVWNEAFNNPRHTYMFLTKRPENLEEWTKKKARASAWPIEDIWPSWMWIGVTAEDQNTADYRIPILTSVPAHIRFVSIEPILGPVNVEKFFWGPSYYHDTPGGQRWRRSDQMLHWIIVGGETGPRPRFPSQSWVRRIRDQCASNDIPFFFKKWCSGKEPRHREIDGQRWEQYPEVQDAL